MQRFSDSTILKGLERVLPYRRSSDEREEILGRVAKYITESKPSIEKPLNPQFYESLEQTLFDAQPVSQNEIKLGKEIYQALRNQKSYDLELSPDSRKLKRFRRKEIEVLNGVMKEYGYW